MNGKNTSFAMLPARSLALFPVLRAPGNGESYELDNVSDIVRYGQSDRAFEREGC